MLPRVGPLDAAQQAEHFVGAGDPGADEPPSSLQIPQVADPDASPTVLVFVRRTYPPPGGPNLFALLARPVKEFVKR